MILRHIPDLTARFADGRIDLADLVDIESDAVHARSGTRGVHLSETDGHYTYILHADLSLSGKLSITDNDREVLRLSLRTRLSMIVPRITAPQTTNPFAKTANLYD